jgi:hypothetical protein
MFFYICGGICLATNILGSLLIFEKEDDTSIVDIKEEEGKQIQKQNDVKNDHEDFPKLTLKDALKLKELYIIAFMFSFCNKSIQSFIGNFKVSKKRIASTYYCNL